MRSKELTDQLKEKEDQLNALMEKKKSFTRISRVQLGEWFEQVIQSGNQVDIEFLFDNYNDSLFGAYDIYRYNRQFTTEIVRDSFTTPYISYDESYSVTVYTHIYQPNPLELAIKAGNTTFVYSLLERFPNRFSQFSKEVVSLSEVLPRNYPDNHYQQLEEYLKYLVVPNLLFYIVCLPLIGDRFSIAKELLKKEPSLLTDKTGKFMTSSATILNLLDFMRSLFSSSENSDMLCKAQAIVSFESFLVKHSPLEIKKLSSQKDKTGKLPDMSEAILLSVRDAINCLLDPLIYGTAIEINSAEQATKIIQFFDKEFWAVVKQDYTAKGEKGVLIAKEETKDQLIALFQIDSISRFFNSELRTLRKKLLGEEKALTAAQAKKEEAERAAADNSKDKAAQEDAGNKPQTDSNYNPILAKADVPKPAYEEFYAEENLSTRTGEGPQPLAHSASGFADQFDSDDLLENERQKESDMSSTNPNAMSVSIGADQGGLSHENNGITTMIETHVTNDEELRHMVSHVDLTPLDAELKIEENSQAVGDLAKVLPANEEGPMTVNNSPASTTAIASTVNSISFTANMAGAVAREAETMKTLSAVPAVPCEAVVTTTLASAPSVPEGVTAEEVQTGEAPKGSNRAQQLAH